MVHTTNPTQTLPPSTLAGLDADVLLTPAAGDPRTLACAYLAVQPRLRVICLADDCRSAHHYHVPGSGAVDGHPADAPGSIVEELLDRLDAAHLIRVIRGTHRAC